MCCNIFVFLLKFFLIIVCFQFCGETSVLTMSSHDKIKKWQRKSTFIPMEKEASGEAVTILTFKIICSSRVPALNVVCRCILMPGSLQCRIWAS